VQPVAVEGSGVRRDWERRPPSEKNAGSCRIAVRPDVLRLFLKKGRSHGLCRRVRARVPKQQIEAFKEFARKAGEVWKEYGALAVVECIGDDVPYGELTPFPRAVQAKEDEVVIFSWVVYETRSQRDAVNAKVMADPRLKRDMSDMPFDGSA
jgi:uncharacterized protein YbaA (DUF1428 family)